MMGEVDIIPFLAEKVYNFMCWCDEENLGDPLQRKMAFVIMSNCDKSYIFTYINRKLSRYPGRLTSENLGEVMRNEYGLDKSTMSESQLEKANRYEALFLDLFNQIRDTESE